MPIPASSCPPGTTPDVCCDTMFLIGDRIRTVACDAVMCCTAGGCNQEFRSYMTFGNRIQDLKGDSLIVTMQNATPAPATRTDAARIGPMTMTRIQYLLELRENGWPQPKARGTNIEQPDGMAVHAATAHAMSHAEIMYQALVNGARIPIGDNALFPINKNPHILLNSIDIGPLLPVGPQTMQVASTVSITVDARLRKAPA